MGAYYVQRFLWARLYRKLAWDTVTVENGVALHPA